MVTSKPQVALLALASIVLLSCKGTPQADRSGVADSGSPSCIIDSDCAEGTRCARWIQRDGGLAGGKCVHACITDSDCPAGEICAMVSHVYLADRRNVYVSQSVFPSR